MVSLLWQRTMCQCGTDANITVEIRGVMWVADIGLILGLLDDGERLIIYKDGGGYMDKSVTCRGWTSDESQLEFETVCELIEKLHERGAQRTEALKEVADYSK